MQVRHEPRTIRERVVVRRRVLAKRSNETARNEAWRCQDHLFGSNDFVTIRARVEGYHLHELRLWYDIHDHAVPKQALANNPFEVSHDSTIAFGPREKWRRRLSRFDRSCGVIEEQRPRAGR